jgi:hypothetical protein
MTIVAARTVLVVIFDNKSSLGLVRLRIKKASDELGKLLQSMERNSRREIGSPFAEISDEDIDNLFSD